MYKERNVNVCQNPKEWKDLTNKNGNFEFSMECSGRREGGLTKYEEVNALNFKLSSDPVLIMNECRDHSESFLIFHFHPTTHQNFHKIVGSLDKDKVQG